MVIGIGDGFNRVGHSLAEALHPCVRCKQVSAGYHVCVLLTDGGSVVIVDTIHLFTSCRISDPKDGVIFLQVSAGLTHALLLRSDGLADTYGDTLTRNATYQSSRRVCSTRKFPQDERIHYC